MKHFHFKFKLYSEPSEDSVVIEARTLTEAVNLFLEGQWPDGEAERTCDDISGFTVKCL